MTSNFKAVKLRNYDQINASFEAIEHYSCKCLGMFTNFKNRKVLQQPAITVCMFSECDLKAEMASRSKQL